ncbi:MAG: efflux RND transporter periplasmic adaptor subunit [Lentisphaeria bacterium]|nr:efflux RND transporter periplasmic adaptor subunit [Lentisphaeria bacterium]
MSNSSNALKIFVKLIIAIGIVALTVVAIKVAIMTKPQAKKRTIKKMIPVVEVLPISKQDQPVTIEAMGLIKPAKTIVLKTRVKGQIMSLNTQFTPGSHLNKGELIAQIDKTDYKINITSRKADLIKAQTELQLEYGRQAIAKHEWTMLKESVDIKKSDNSLALRKPQLKFAKATVEAAQIALDRAVIELERTSIHAPFESTIVTTDVNEGDQADLQTQLATLLSTDVYWAELSIAVSKLKWLQIPGITGSAGSTVQITSKDGLQSEGKIIKLLPDLQKNGRMARVLVEISDPTAISINHQRPLLIGEYVKATINGKVIKSVTQIPRSAYKNNREIWLISAKNTLMIQPLNLLWENSQYVYTDTEISSTNRLIVNGLTLPISGMSLKALPQVKEKTNE